MGKFILFVICGRVPSGEMDGGRIMLLDRYRYVFFFWFGLFVKVESFVVVSKCEMKMYCALGQIQRMKMSAFFFWFKRYKEIYYDLDI